MKTNAIINVANEPAMAPLMIAQKIIEYGESSFFIG